MLSKIRKLKQKTGKRTIVGALYAAAGAAAMNVVVTCPAFAESGSLTEVKNMLASGVQFLGGVLAIWGIVQVGLQYKDGGAGGGQLNGAIAWIVGGGLVFGGGTILKALNPGW